MSRCALYDMLAPSLLFLLSLIPALQPINIFVSTFTTVLLFSHQLPEYRMYHP